MVEIRTENYEYVVNLGSRGTRGIVSVVKSRLNGDIFLNWYLDDSRGNYEETRFNYGKQKGCWVGDITAKEVISIGLKKSYDSETPEYEAFEALSECEVTA